MHGNTKIKFAVNRFHLGNCERFRRIYANGKYFKQRESIITSTNLSSPDIINQ